MCIIFGDKLSKKYVSLHREHIIGSRGRRGTTSWQVAHQPNSPNSATAAEDIQNIVFDGSFATSRPLFTK